MIIGSCTWPIKWFPPYDEAIKDVARLGFKGVELTAWNNEIVAEYYTPETIRHLRDLIASEGLTLTAVYFSQGDFGSEDAAKREAAVGAFERAADAIAALGSPVLNGAAPYPFAIEVAPLLTRPTAQEWTVDVPRKLDWDKNYDDYVAVVRRCSEICTKVGVKLALEPHPYRWVCGAQSVLRLIDRSGADNLGLNLDPSHLFPMGEMPHYTAYQMGKRIYNTHFSDNDGQTNAHWRPGKGKIDWGAVLCALQDIGYDGPITIELEDVPGSAFRGREATPEILRQLRLSAQYVKMVADEVGVAVDGLQPRG
jgi:sugar phosphate isomerase/epimerase